MTNSFSREDLESIGYVWQRRCKCRGCVATIEWFQTSSGRFIPYRLHPRDGRLVDHREECPGHKQIQQPKAKAKSPQAKAQKAKPVAAIPQTGRLF